MHTIKSVKAMLTYFLNEVTEPKKGFISPSRLCKTLHMQLGELARVSGTHRNTLQRNPASPNVQNKLGEIIKIIEIATKLTQDYGKAVVWFKYEPLSGFDHKTAAQLVQAGHGDAVIKHLKMLEDGVYA